MGPRRKDDQRESVSRDRQRDGSIGAAEHNAKQPKEGLMENRAILLAAAGLPVRLHRGPRAWGTDFRIEDHRRRLRSFRIGGSQQVGLP